MHSGEYAADAAIRSSLSLVAGSRHAQITSQDTRRGTRTSTLLVDPHRQPHGEAWDPLALHTCGSGLSLLWVSLCWPGLSAEPLITSSSCVSPARSPYFLSKPSCNGNELSLFIFIFPLSLLLAN